MPSGDRRCRFRPLVLTALLFLSVACDSGSTRHRDVLKASEGSSDLEFNRCRLGVGHYVGLAPLELTTSQTIQLQSVRVTAPPDSVEVSGQIAYYDRQPVIGGFDGDEDFPKAFADRRFAPLQGAEVRPGTVPFYLLVRVAAKKPGRIVAESVHLDYRVDGRPATHTFPYSLILNDYEDETTAEECKGVARL